VTEKWLNARRTVRYRTIPEGNIAFDHFTSNGQADLLFQNTNGAMRLWEMKDTNIVAEVKLLNPGTGWQSVSGHPFATG
jgi:hypothetical protein